MTEQNIITSVSELNDMSLSALFELARSWPKEEAIINRLFEKYETTGTDDIDEKLTYLRLRWLSSQSKWSWLNELTKAFEEANQKRNMYKCLVESLRENPLQEDVFDKCEQFKEYSRPEYPQKLRENKCTLSVTMTVHNRPRIMREAISSILNQTFQNYELIIVNDGGPDEVEKAVQSFEDKRIKYFKLPKRSGYSVAQNKAISEASGEYIAYLDDDDVYYPEHLATMVCALKRSSKKVVYNNTRVVTGVFEDGRFVTQFVNIAGTEKFSRERLLVEGWFGNNNIIHHRSVHLKAGLYDDNLLLTSEDWDMWLRIASHYDFDYVDATTSECHIRADNISVKNRECSLFYRVVLGNFYRFCKGKIAYAKYFLARGEGEKARLLYDEIVADYEDYFRSPAMIRELIDLAGHFKETRFLMKLSRDYFIAGPRKWKKEALNNKPFEMILGALPAVPKKVFDKFAEYYWKQGRSHV